MDVVYSDDCLLHNPPLEVTRGVVQAYVESPARLESIKKFIDSQPHFRIIAPNDYTLTPISNVLGEDYIRFLQTIYDDWVAYGLPKDTIIGDCFGHVNTISKIDPEIVKETVDLTPMARVGMYAFDISVGFTADTWRSVYTSAQIALTGAHQLLQLANTDPDNASIYALCRPPGHHAACNVSGGYCFINNVAVAARFLQEYTLEEMNTMSKPVEFDAKTTLIPTGPKPKPSNTKKKVLIVDVDFHHGNGTQDIFYDDPSVLYVSLHGYPAYPYFTGSAKEIGSGEGKGYNINVPLDPKTTTDEIYLNNLKSVLQGEFATKFNADFVIVSMGLDTWHEDPIAGMKGLKNLSTYSQMGKLLKTSNSCKGRPVLFVQEGGYTVEKLGLLAAQILNGYLEK
ncbi:hypothetical protein BJV82DRAFT_605336 [Fennellomyces sp. T-0311]|nr:hypothetical protein BJV82DRAFT_605336 [Fennellomyces sp. T-0311]